MNKIYTIIKEHMKNDKLLSYNDLLNYALRLKYENELDKYVENVKFSNTDSKYDQVNRILAINPYEIFIKTNKCPLYSNSIGKIISDEDYNTHACVSNSLNIYNLLTINHEITHAVQKKIMEKKLSDFYQSDFYLLRYILLKISNIAGGYDEYYFDNKAYNNFHDYFFFEYDACISSYLEVIALMNAFNLDKLHDEIVKINALCASYIHFSYKNINDFKSPSTPRKNTLKIFYKVLELMKRDNISLEEDDEAFIRKFEKINVSMPSDQIERIRLGLQLSESVHSYINDIAFKKKKTLNLFHEVKNIS